MAAVAVAAGLCRTLRPFVDARDVTSMVFAANRHYVPIFSASSAAAIDACASCRACCGVIGSSTVELVNHKVAFDPFVRVLDAV